MCRFVFAIFMIMLPMSGFSVTLENANNSYVSKKYAIAYEQYIELAQLGNARAQYGLGVMYLNGHGVEQNLMHAYAWLRLSAQNREPRAIKAMAKFSNLLKKDEKKRYDIHSLATLKEYGPRALRKKLYPTFSVDPDRGAFSEALPVFKKKPVFPKYTRLLYGQVTLDYIVGKDGRTKYHNAVSFTDDEFLESALEAIKSSLYMPALFGESAVETFSIATRFEFEMSGTQAVHDVILENLKDSEKLALSGTSLDRYRHAKYFSVMHFHLRKEDKKLFRSSNYWLNQSAVDGLPIAKFELGRRIFYGEQCDSEPDKGYFWLKSAAEDGFSTAQMLLGLERYRGVRYEKNELEGLKWLERAADQQFVPAMNELALIFATAQNDTIKNLVKATNIVESIDKKQVKDRISYYEAMAVVYHQAKNEAKLKYALKKLKKEVRRYGLPYKKVLSNVENIANNRPMIILADVSQD